MSKPLKILIIDDSEKDVELILHQLKRGNYDVIHQRVDTASALADALKQESWDLIISDYAMPQFNGLAALELYQEQDLDFPFLIVSEQIGEDHTVAAMKAGVHDYIVKENLDRLVPSIKHELKAAHTRRMNKEAQEDLRQSEAWYRGLFEHVPIGLYRTTPSGKFLDANQALVDLLSYPNKQSLLSTNVIELYVNPQDRQRVIDVLAHERIVTGWEVQFKRFDGIYIWVENTARAILNGHGSVLYFEGSIQDVTERRSAAQSLLESEERFRRLSQASFEGISITSQGNFIDVNEQFSKMLGYERDELIGQPVMNLVAPESRELVAKHMQTRYEKPYEHLAQKKDGTIFPVEVHGKSISYSWGTARVTAVKDITERKLAEEALRNSEERLSSFMDSASDSFYLLDSDMNFVEINLKGLEIIGRQKQDVIGMNIAEIVPDVKASGRYDKHLEVMRTGISFVVEDFIPHPIFGNMNFMLKSFKVGNGLGVIASDITERVKTEQALRESEGRYRSLFYDSPISLWEEDYTTLFTYLNELRDQGVTNFRDYFESRPHEVAHCASLVEVIDVNKATLDLYKAGSKAELIANLHKIIIDESYLAFKDQLIALAEGQTQFSTEVSNLTLDGDTIDVNVSVSVVPTDEEAQSKILLSLTDITERKQAEKEIQNHLNRLETIREIELSILAAQSPQDTAMTALEHIQALLPYDFGGVVLYDFDTNQVEFLATYPYTNDNDPLITRSYTIDEFTPYQDTLRSGQIYIMPDLAAEIDLNLASRLIKESGIRSFIDVPLMARGDLIGSFNVLSEQPNAFEPVHLDIAREVANSLAVSIQQGRLLETEQRRREELETLEHVSISLRQADTREQLFSILLTETRSLFNADSGAILTPLEDKFQYTIIQGPEEIETFLMHQRFAEDELVEIINAEDPVFLTELPFDMMDVASANVFPIKFNQQTYGAMILHWFEYREFPTEERYMLNTIVDMAGIAIERMHILENLEVQVADRTFEITTLYELTALLAAEGDLTDTLQQTLKRLLETINSYSGAIHLMNDEHNKLDLITHQGFDSETTSSLNTIFPDHILWEQLVEKSEPLLLMNIEEQDLITAGIQNLEVENYIGAPIQSGRETLGIISVFYSPDHDPSLDEISLLNLVADQIGIAVERTRLRKQAEQAAIISERQRLARELHDAVTQSLYSLSFLAKASLNFAQAGEWDQVEQHLNTLQDTAQQALKEMRLLIYELIPTALEQQGLASVLRYRLESVEQRAGVEIEFSTAGSFELPTEVQFDIYRIAQEALNNTLKHAAATAVKVQLVYTDNGLDMTIEDNGIGFDLQQTSGGMGLDSMRNRAEKLGGTLTITSNPNQGTQVKLTIDEVIL